jgi:hypothetical protein
MNRSTFRMKIRSLCPCASPTPQNPFGVNLVRVARQKADTQGAGIAYSIIDGFRGGTLGAPEGGREGAAELDGGTET